MLNRGDWVIPHVNGLPYLEKPPLYFWLTALTFRLVGQAEWTVRIWSALSALGAGSPVLLVDLGLPLRFRRQTRRPPRAAARSLSCGRS